ncbi:phosphopantetheine-binding protein [Actinokineospora pegani]|uniref:phosphopantetheine-binding protein n=1 Tax=Actinokineospora pegani TaxID=2654637 RepID=UPI0012EA0570|nr:phosphopantetheine-binding protein [Actinokineospora pegani]
MTDHKPAIRAFLTQFFATDTLGDEDDFFAIGLVNSLFVMQLVLFVENQLGAAVDDEDLERANFASISAIDALVRRKSSVQAAT